MIFGINTTISNFTRLTAREITYNDSEISHVSSMPNITTNHAIAYTNLIMKLQKTLITCLQCNMDTGTVADTLQVQQLIH